MGKPLSRPGCLQRSPCCSRKEEGEGYNEDGYIPQRSIYDTMCINEHIDQGSAQSTLGSKGGRDSSISRNGSLGTGVGDMFETRSSILLGSGRKLDERFIFDSLKLAHDELSRSPGAFVKSASPSVSCSSAPSGSMTKRHHHHQDSGKKDNFCRHSWKVLTPPKLPEPLELSPGEKHLLNPGTAFFPSSFTSPQISPFSGSPLSSGPHTPPVFFSPLPYHQQFHRQSLPTQITSPRPPLSELSVTALMSSNDTPGVEEKRQIKRTDIEWIKEKPFSSVKTKTVGLGNGHDPTPEPDSDTTPLLHSKISQVAVTSPVVMESTWPRRLIGRRRTVRQDGATHNLPILPPLPSLLMRSVTEKKPRLSPFPEHQGTLEGKLGKSPLVGELKDCLMQEWRILQEREERKAKPVGNDGEKEQVLEAKMEDKIEPVKEEDEQNTNEFTGPDTEVENWDAVLEMVNSLWDDGWLESDSQHTDSLRRWPLLQPPTGFGGSQAPSGTSSELGAEDLLELERMNKEEIEDTQGAESPDQDQNQIKSSLQAGEEEQNVIVLQPKRQDLSQTKIPTSLDLTTLETQMGNKHGHSGSPDSNLTLDSDSSGIYMSNPSHTSHEDIASDSDKPMSDLDVGGTTSFELGKEDAEKIFSTGLKDDKQSPQTGSLNKKSHKQSDNENVNVKTSDSQKCSKLEDGGPVKQDLCHTVNMPKTDLPLPLSPSKHEVRGTVLDSGDTDSFVATDSFVYLAVSVLPPVTQVGVSTTVNRDLSHPNSFSKSSTYPDECDFLSTDSFVYLAAPDCNMLVTEGHSVYGGSKDSDSDSESEAEFVLASTIGDSDWDSDLSDAESQPKSSQPVWDHWEELEHGVLQELFCDNQPGTSLLRDVQPEQVSWQQGELAAQAIVTVESAEQEASPS